MLWDGQIFLLRPFVSSLRVLRLTFTQTSIDLDLLMLALSNHAVGPWYSVATYRTSLMTEGWKSLVSIHYLPASILQCCLVNSCINLDFISDWYKIYSMALCMSCPQFSKLLLYIIWKVYIKKTLVTKLNQWS